MTVEHEAWFITGASTGLGRALARTVLDRGGRVIATARDAATLEDLVAVAPQRALALALDVTEPARVTNAVAQAEEWSGGIDIVVNNAGHGFVGATEELSDEQCRAVFDTNVFGVLTVLRAVLPHLRRRRRGHIVQMSSVAGAVANPGHALYGASKFALEGLSEALAGEVGPLGIGVTIVEPGPFRTDFAGRSMRYATPIGDYAATPAGELRERFAVQDGRQPNDPVRAAELIVEAVHAPTPPLRLPLGPEAVQRIRDKLSRQRHEIDEWADRGADTRYADRASA